MSEYASVWVPGVPVPKGSLRAFTRRGGGVGVEEGNVDRLRPWMSSITLAARDAKMPLLEGPVAVGLTFYLPRPKGHFRADGRTLRPSAPRYPTTKPDLDKLVRAVLDALSGVAFRDDAQVVALDPSARKLYEDNVAPCAFPPGVQIDVTSVGGGGR